MNLDSLCPGSSSLSSFHHHHQSQHKFKLQLRLLSHSLRSRLLELSKAVDWLIKKVKPAIDELAELPPWNPETVTNTARAKSSNQQNLASKNYQFDNSAVENIVAGSGSRAAGIVGSEVRNLQIGENQNPSNNSSRRIHRHRFFPMGASTDTPPSFWNYPLDLLSRTSSHRQDLCLSLQSFQEPNFLHQQNPAQSHQSEPMLFSGSGLDGSSAGWESHHPNPTEISRFQRTGAADANSGGGMIFGSPQPFFGHNSHQLFSSQRGPLQSSNQSSKRITRSSGVLVAGSSLKKMNLDKGLSRFIFSKKKLKRRPF